MELIKELWGKSACGKEIYLYTLKNESGAYVQLSSVGAGIVSVVVPDKDGALADVCLGYPEAASYFGDGPCAGKVPGRFANRIALGKFELDGVEYELPINNGPNHLHGGPDGFQHKVWESREHEGGVEFLYYSEDGEMGYPGALKAVARYDWTEENELRLTLTAEADAPTIVNLTNHAYFNLNGEGSGDVLGHELRLNASEYLPTSESLIPVGESEPVAGTPMDFVNSKALGAEIKADFPALNYGKGYDNCWVIDGYEPGQIQEAAELLMEQKEKGIVQAYVMDQIFDKMINNEAAIGTYYAGDYVIMAEENPDLAFCMPEEGANMFVDSMCIPTCCQEKEAAELFINFMCRDDIVLRNCDAVGYSTPSATAHDKMDPELAEDPITYPSEDVLAKCESFGGLPFRFNAIPAASLR